MRVPLLSLCCVVSACTSEPHKPTLRVTAVPDENPTELHRKYAPLVDYLEEQMGVAIDYVPVTDYGAAVMGIAGNKVDFAWLGGFTHVQARVLSGAVPLCMREIDREFKSVFIAHVDSGISSMADLKGKKFAFGSQSSTSGHLMPRHFLTTSYGIDPDKDFARLPVFSGAHDATAKMVESGSVEAGALNSQVWERIVSDESVNLSKLKVIWTTPAYVDYVWTARKDVDLAFRDRFREAFVSLDINRPEHKTILDLQGAKKFVVASASDFDAIEAVGRSTGLLK